MKQESKVLKTYPEVSILCETQVFAYRHITLLVHCEVSHSVSITHSFIYQSLKEKLKQNMITLK